MTNSEKIRLTCPECNSEHIYWTKGTFDEFRLKLELLCHQCKNTFSKEFTCFPNVSEELKFECKKCGNHIEADNISLEFHGINIRWICDDCKMLYYMDIGAD